MDSEIDRGISGSPGLTGEAPGGRPAYEDDADRSDHLGVGGHKAGDHFVINYVPGHRT